MLRVWLRNCGLPALALYCLGHVSQGLCAPIDLSCTTTQLGKAVINEVQTQNSFIEVYFNQAADLAAWSLWISGSGSSPVQIPLGLGNCYANGTTTKDNASSGSPTTRWPAGTFIACDSSIAIPSQGEILLVDKQTAPSSNDKTVIDALNYGNPPQNEWSVDPTCSTLYDGHSASNKDIARIPDGSGALTDNGDNSTKGTTNTPTPPPATPGNFNAVEVGANDVSGVIKTKIAGQAFSLDIVALNPAGNSTLPSYTGTMNLYLVNAASSASCSSMTVLQSLGSHTFTGAGSGKDNGRKTLSITYANAAANVRVKMVDTSAGLTACSSDNFAVRPYSLANAASAASVVAATDADWQTAGTERSLNNSSASGGVVHKAGRPFTLRAQAYSATGAGTPGYTGTPSLSLVSCVLPASGCVSGALSAGSVSTSSGLASSSTATYSEVGTVRVKLSDSTFAAVDANDGSSLAERTLESSVFTIGRFIPDHFALAANSAAFAPGCATFTYLGQPFGFGAAPVWTVTAQNLANATTQNYTGSLFKLAASTVTQTWSAASGTVAAVGTLPDVGVSDSGGGIGTLTFDVGIPGSGGGLAFARTALASPFSASLTLSASVTDSEGVAYASNPYQQTGIGFVGGNNMQRFGRLRISNAVGSELLALPVPLTAQYWNGQGFVSNAADYCTSLAAPSLTFYAPSANNQLASGETSATYNSPLAAGVGNLRLSAPGAGNYGYLDLTITAPAWLQYNWDGIDQGNDGNLFDDNPHARAAFGKRKGADKVIIRREIY